MENNYLPIKTQEYQNLLSILFKEELQQRKLKIANITFQVTEDCCMACTYCYQHNKSKNKMTFETAKKIIDKLLNDGISLYPQDETFTIIIDFIGGEPLMEIDLIDQICTYMIKQMIKLEHPWLYFCKFSICSNGLLYNTPKVQSFLKKYHNWVSYSISIDGDKELHDSCRVDLQGKGTYERVNSAIQSYAKDYSVQLTTKMTLSPDNIYSTFRALKNLVDLGYQTVMVNCIYEKGWTNKHATVLYNELKNLADYLIDNNLYRQTFIRLLDEELFCPLDPNDKNDNENWCGGTGNKCLAFDYKGDIYPCIRYMESSLDGKQKPLKIGNIDTGYGQSSNEQANLKLLTNITRRSQSTDECFYCPIAKGCAWCSAYNYEEFGTPNKRATYACCMHKAQSLANVYYWNKLYKKLNINKNFKMYLPKNEALKLIDEKEYNYLSFLSTGGI